MKFCLILLAAPGSVENDCVPLPAVSFAVSTIGFAFGTACLLVSCPIYFLALSATRWMETTELMGRWLGLGLRSITAKSVLLCC